ncbi:hypothetical protein FRC11_010526 [Ceratobasidium sp. 423]|nr:hypothetical protein FRC11_010526 [Ceratobasidium sp. 423]
MGPLKSYSRGEPTMPSLSETSKRKIGALTTEEFPSIAKKIKASTPTSSSSTPPVAGIVSEAKNNTNDASSVPPEAVAYPGAPGASKLPVDGCAPKFHRSLAAPSTTPRRAERPTVSAPGTPIRLSTSNIDPSCISPSQSSSRRSGGGPNTQDSRQTQEAMKSNDITKVPLEDIREMLKHEFCGAVYLHKEFFKEFLEPKQDIQTQVLQQVRDHATEPTRSLGQRNCVDYDNTRNQWTLDKVITNQRDEKKVYEPLAKALNVIGRAAFEVYHAMHPDDTIRKNYSPFINHSTSDTRSDSPSDGATKPDLLQGRVDGGRVHWGDCELIVECKSKSEPKLHNEAYMQLARYARAIFAHQIYRVGVFGFSLCGPVVNFVHFDRSGMLHSPDIDLSKPGGPHAFIRCIITLLTLDARNYGYDNRYSFDYEVSPPRTLFKFGDHSPEPVNEIICHRKCCSGRATCVTGVGELVHKAIWRPEDRKDEGETMMGFVNVFAFCQLMGASCDHNTKLKYPDELEWSAASRLFIPQSWKIPTTTISRCIRIQSDILMQRGASLFEAQNPLHLVIALKDVVLGIMGLLEVGKLHCDISAYNILLINPAKHYPDQNWLAQPKFKIIPDVWKRTARGTPGTNNDGDSGGRADDGYESPRLKLVKELGRGPYCVLHDTEFTIDERSDDENNQTGCTGTPTFISAQLLTADRPISRAFIHDIESLFWVLVWVLIRRTQDPNGPWKVNEHAKELIRQLSNSDLSALGKYKLSLLSSAVSGDFGKTIMDLQNPWCEDLAPLAQAFAGYLYYYLYHTEPGTLPPLNTPARAASEYLILQHNQYQDQPHKKTFDDLFNMFDERIRILEKKYQVDLTKL